MKLKILFICLSLFLIQNLAFAQKDSLKGQRWYFSLSGYYGFENIISKSSSAPPYSRTDNPYSEVNYDNTYHSYSCSFLISCKILKWLHIQTGITRINQSYKSIELPYTIYYGPFTKRGSGLFSYTYTFIDTGIPLNILFNLKLTKHFSVIATIGYNFLLVRREIWELSQTGQGSYFSNENSASRAFHQISNAGIGIKFNKNNFGISLKPQFY